MRRGGALRAGALGAAAAAPRPRLDVVRIPSLADNYIWLLHEAESGRTAAVDPGDAAPLLAALAERCAGRPQSRRKRGRSFHAGVGAAASCCPPFPLTGAGGWTRC
jgi:hydroxyacylglutathione hydrolase